MSGWHGYDLPIGEMMAQMRAQGEGSVFKAGDVVGLREPVGILPREGSVVVGTRYIYGDHEPQYQIRCEVSLGTLFAWVPSRKIYLLNANKPTEQSKVASEVEYKVGDVVGLKENSAVQYDAYTIYISRDPADDWEIVSERRPDHFIGHYEHKFRVESGYKSGWTPASNLIPRPKSERLAQTVRVIETSEWVDMNGTNLRVRLTDEDSGVDVLFRADLCDKTIHIGDEYTVTITKKG